MVLSKLSSNLRANLEFRHSFKEYFTPNLCRFQCFQTGRNLINSGLPDKVKQSCFCNALFRLVLSTCQMRLKMKFMNFPSNYKFQKIFSYIGVWCRHHHSTLVDGFNEK